MHLSLARRRFFLAKRPHLFRFSLRPLFSLCVSRSSLRPLRLCGEYFFGGRLDFSLYGSGSSGLGVYKIRLQSFSSRSDKMYFQVFSAFLRGLCASALKISFQAPPGYSFFHSRLFASILTRRSSRRRFAVEFFSFLRDLSMKIL